MSRYLIAASLMLASTLPAVAAVRQAQAVSVATADAAAMPSPGTLRYVWLHADGPELVRAVDVAVNTACGQTSVLSRTVPIGSGVLRVDLANYAQDEAGLRSLVQTWERFAETEPYFLQPIGLLAAQSFAVSAETPLRVRGKNVGKIPAGTIVVPLRTVDGSEDSRWHEVEFQGVRGFIPVTAVKVTDGAAVEGRVFGEHCGQDAVQLSALCSTSVPIVRADWLVVRMLSTLDGGLYYEFRGIGKSTDSKVSDFELFLRTFAGVTDRDVAALGSDSKVAMLRSNVTGKPRAVLLFSGAQAKSPVNQGLVAITQDPADGDVDPGADPLLNLAQASYAAIEVFAEMPNGLIAYGLYSGDLDGNGVFDRSKKEGEIQREAPPNIVVDHTVPEPHTARLQPAISCIRCHSKKLGEDWTDGWLPAPNDVATLLDSGLDVFGDVRLAGGGINRIASLYSGSWDKPFNRARDDHAEALLRLVGIPPEGQTAVSVAHGAVVAVYGRYAFDLVTPAVACAELGVQVGENARETFSAVVPAASADGLAIEDVRIGALKAGLAINRLQWEAVYPLAVSRLTIPPEAPKKP